MYKLTPFPEVRRYSVLEFELFDALPQDGSAINTKDLVYARLRRGVWDVQHPRSIVATVMDTLMQKVETNNEPFRIVREYQLGAMRKEARYCLRPVEARRSAAAESRASVLD